MAKLHIYTVNEPAGESIIVGDKNGLLRLAKALERAATNEIDYQKFHSGDGHEYRVVTCKETDEDIWSYLELPYTDEAFVEDRDEYIPPENLESVSLNKSEKHKLK